MKQFTKISPEQITDNPFTLLDKVWMLITAGNKQKFNTMTASWGTLGVLWNKPIATTFIRPTRYTYQFAEEFSEFTLSFFDEKYRQILSYCGAKSGRDEDKIARTGLIPLETELGNIYFEQARLVLECKKIYFDDLQNSHFIEPKVEKHYPKKDYHRFYIGEIVNVLKEIN